MALNVEERTVGFLLRSPLDDGSTYGSNGNFRHELVQFLDGPEDEEIIRQSPCSERIFSPDREPYIDLHERNPFLGAYHHYTAKFLLRAAAMKDFSVREGLLASAQDPFQSGPSLKSDSEIGSSYSVSNQFLFYHILASELGSDVDVRQRMEDYLKNFEASVEILYEKHLVRKEPFELTGWAVESMKMAESIEDDPRRQETINGVNENFQERMMQQLNTRKRDLPVARLALDLEFCRNPDHTKHPELYGGTSTDWNDIRPISIGLSLGDQHLVRTLKTLEPADLSRYFEKYGFNES